MSGGHCWVVPGVGPAPLLADSNLRPSSLGYSVPKSLPSFNVAVYRQFGVALSRRLGASYNVREAYAFPFDSVGQSGGERDVLGQMEEARVARSRTVAVFWDLDNKPPNFVPPYDAALRLKRLAGQFGEVVDMVAYANQNAFSYVPYRVREERLDRKMMDRLERQGVLKPEQPYICSLCGRKSKTNLDLKKHFKQLHERERNKRVVRLKQLKGKKRASFIRKVADKEARYQGAARTVIVPKVGYGLAGDLKRAGVMVRTVDKKPQAADEALRRHMNFYINRGIDCILLVSDDSDFRSVLVSARNKHVSTVVIGDTGILRGVSDASFSWEDVASGRAMMTASSTVQSWAGEDLLRAELLSDDEFDDDVDAASSDDDEDDPDFQTTLNSHLDVSVFADDEEGYTSDEERVDENDESYRGWGLDEIQSLNTQTL